MKFEQEVQPLERNLLDTPTQIQAASLLCGHVILGKFSYLRLWIVSDHLI